MVTYDPMTYQPGMEQIDSTVFQQVIDASNAFDASRYTAKQVQAALQKEVLSMEDYAALLAPAAQPFLEQMAARATAKINVYTADSTAAMSFTAAA